MSLKPVVLGSAALSIAMSAALVAVPVWAAAAPAAAPAAPAIRLVTATTHITYERITGDPVYYVQLGAHGMAGDSPFEVRASRASYQDPVVAERVTRQGNRQTVTRLPAGLVSDLSGLTGFLHVRVAGPGGAVVLDRDTTYCPNAWSAVRSRPDAPGTSPYPQMCTGLPFALGQVWGLQAGWSTELFLDMFDQPLDVPDGDYTVTASISPAYRSAFGIPADQAQSTATLTVHSVDLPARPGSAAAQASSASSASPAAVAAAAANRRAAGARPAFPLRLEGARPASPSGTEAARGIPLRPEPTRPRASGAAAAAPANNTRPDLRALPAFNVVATPGEFGATGDFLAFAANVWNAGPSPLVVDGFRRPGTNLMDAYQYFYNSSGRQVGSAPTGTLEYDARDGHNHWHFTDFATYRLLDANQQLAVRSEKEAFCLAPTDAIDLLVRSANWKPDSTGLATACGSESALAIREALPAGWGDTYVQFIPGQSFDITDLPNGTYYIEVIANPDHKLYETSTANNTSLRKVVLGGTPGARTVQVPPVGLINAP